MRSIRQAKPAAVWLLATLVCWGAGHAAAADHAGGIGTRCCADIERRIAELEETTARRGNREVSVTVTGLVNQAVMSWDDGAEDNAYVVTNDNQRSRFSFVGKAAITEQWTAGYAFDVGLRAASSKLVNQVADGGFDEPPPTGFALRSSVWFLRHKKYGTGFVGSTFAATDRIANSNVTQTAKFDQYSAPENAGLGMFLRSSTNGRMTGSFLNWRRIIGAGGDQPGESQRGFQLFKYVSPTWNGFTAAADWVTSDFWDAALRYRKEIWGFDIGAGVAYLQLIPGSRTRSVCPSAFIAPDADATACTQLRGSVSAKHLDSGLFVNLGANLTTDGIVEETVRYRDTGVDGAETFIAGQAGIEEQFVALGKTTIYGSYYRFQGGAATPLLVGPADALNPTGSGQWTVWSSDVDIWGAGIGQGIDSASMILYLNYKRVSGELKLRQIEGITATGPIANAPIDDLHLVMSGAAIQF